jgi:hypothetical protein
MSPPTTRGDKTMTTKTKVKAGPLLPAVQKIDEPTRR